MHFNVAVIAKLMAVRRTRRIDLEIRRQIALAAVDGLDSVLGRLGLFQRPARRGFLAAVALCRRAAGRRSCGSVRGLGHVLRRTGAGAGRAAVAAAAAATAARRGVHD